MPISDDAVMKLAEGLGTLNGTLTQFVENQGKTNDRILDLYQKHVESDEKIHDTLKNDVISLKTSRKVQRAVMTTAAVGGAGGAGVKAGWLAKFIAIVSAASGAGVP